MGITLTKTVNFGTARGGLSTIGFALYNSLGVATGSRSTTGVNEVGSSTGIYAASIKFDSIFSGTILWDSGESSNKAYAAEEYNSSDERIKFIEDMSAGKWHINDTAKQMIFYGSDNITEVARFGLSGSGGDPAVENVYTRNRE